MSENCLVRSKPRSSRQRGTCPRLALMAAAALLATVTASAQLPQPSTLPDYDPNDVLTVTANKVLAQSAVPNLLAPMTLLSYTFEDVTLPVTVEIDDDTGPQFYSTAVRVTITGGQPFFVGDAPPVLWIGANKLILQPVVVSGILPPAELWGIIYDRSILQNGLPIGVNYDLDEVDPTDLFPQPLTLLP